jgi:GNAT superfamily N-acetyltransferase
MPIREIDPLAEHEIRLVAQRMRDTLIEVEGPETGAALYTMDWLRERVLYHLDPAATTAKVLLATADDGEIIGHTIVRRESGGSGPDYGLIATTYVVPVARRSGVAHRLLEAGENWITAQGLRSAATWTSESNARLLGLYFGHGYAIVADHVHDVTGTRMVKLEKVFAFPSTPSDTRTSQD